MPEWSAKQCCKSIVQTKKSLQMWSFFLQKCYQKDKRDILGLTNCFSHKWIRHECCSQWICMLGSWSTSRMNVSQEAAPALLLQTSSLMKLKRGWEGKESWQCWGRLAESSCMETQSEQRKKIWLSFRQWHSRPTERATDKTKGLSRKAKWKRDHFTDNAQWWML